MKTRAITGFFFVIIMLSSVIFSEYAFVFFFMLLSLLTLDEFYRLVSDTEVKPQRLFGMLIASAIFIPVIFKLLANSSWKYLGIVIPLVVLACIVELYRKSSKPFHNLAYTFFGQVYVVMPFVIFTACGFINDEYNFHLPLGIMVLLWASDTGAYLFGVKWGKNRLFERHSPKKSWEGFFGGMFTSLLVAFILSTQYHELSAIHWAAIAVLIVIGGTYGDLCESMLKRSMDKKDSGSLLPGHGGLLDRFDALLFAAPLVFVYLYLIIS